MTRFDETPTSGAPNLGPLEAVELVAEGAQLLDVRELDEWQAGHAEAALHVPLGALAEALDQLSIDKPVVCVCRSGGRSAQAADALVRVGYDAWNLAGGMQAWAAAGLAFVDAEGAPGTVI
ncbi:MAG: Rhodanese-related sulfurtransferase [Acidimicrobiaceae bacterium]|nr:Rhodanese-related sulfurtransferase [Acidimicrobiaceae bacterium]